MNTQSHEITTEQQMFLLDFLVVAQNFSTCLMCSYLSSQSFLQSETGQAAEQFFTYFIKMREHSPEITDDARLISSIIDRGVDIDEIIRLFNKRVYNADPLFNDVISTVNFCLKQLGSKIPIPDWQMWQVEQYRKNRVRWEAHLPEFFLTAENDPAEYLRKISNSHTIVVVGDIRKSQDLMTYAEQPTDYSENIGKFMTKARELVFEYRGIFDKFTGDGFVAYFNEAMCARLNREFINCFINFVQDVQKYADLLFPEWIESIRKYPSTAIGLSIGADIGRVQFDDKDQHFVAFDDSIVWATRMCAEGHAGELIVNNLLYHKLKNIRSLKFIERSSQTKSGENFLARRVEERQRYLRPKRSKQ